MLRPEIGKRASALVFSGILGTPKWPNGRALKSLQQASPRKEELGYPLCVHLDLCISQFYTCYIVRKFENSFPPFPWLSLGNVFVLTPYYTSQLRLLGGRMEKSSGPGLSTRVAYRQGQTNTCWVICISLSTEDGGRT